MASGTKVYRGYTIHWDTVSSADGWNAEADVLFPADSSGFCNIIGTVGCESEAEARDFVLRAARERIDEIHGEKEQHTDEFVRRPMQLRDCPLMSHRGTRNWPPTWNKTGGGSRAGSYETLGGEIGTLQQVRLSKIEPYNTCYLVIEFRRMTYVGTLVFDDAMFCRQLCKLLQNDYLGKSIKDIGDLEAGRFL